MISVLYPVKLTQVGVGLVGVKIPCQNGLSSKGVVTVVWGSAEGWTIYLPNESPCRRQSRRRRNDEEENLRSMSTR